MKRMLSVAMLPLVVVTFLQAQKKPNILVIFGDDIGQTANLITYSFGVASFSVDGVEDEIDEINAQKLKVRAPVGGK